MEVSKEKNFY